MLLQCIQQLLCSQYMSLVIVLGEVPLHIHRDELTNAHELVSHNPFSVCEFHALLVLCRRRKTPEMPPQSTTHRTLVGLTARSLRQASPPRGLHTVPCLPGSKFLGETLALLCLRVL